MDFNFGLIQASGRRIYVSWSRLFFLYSMLCMWTGVDSWSYFYSNKMMNWEDARAWCREHYTDMVAIQNQDEIQHLNSWLPHRRGYYWIGIRKINDVWTWVGTNKTLTKEATNWAEREPNNGQLNQTTGNSEDCVEMYIKRDQEPGKWNDEWCGKKKTALCFSAACKGDSCVHGECVETIESHKCDCFPGFHGQKCEQAIRCPHLEAPENGNMTCSKHEPVFDTQCSFTCDQDYALNGHELLICDHHDSWSGQKPTCRAVISKTVITASVAAGGSAVGSGLLVSLWILKKLRNRVPKFDLNRFAVSKTAAVPLYISSLWEFLLNMLL